MTLLVVALQRALLPAPTIAPFVFFFFAVALTSWLAGRLPGLLTVVLSAAAANYLFIEPLGAWSVHGSALTATALFLAAASAVALLCGAFRQTLVEMQRVLSEQKMGELALRHERDFSSAVLDTAGALVLVVDREGRITRFNHACEAASGYSAAQVYGRHYDFLAPAEDWPSLRKVWEAVVSGHFPTSLENDLVAKDGSRHRVAWTCTAILTPKGEVEHLIATGLDITQRSRADAAVRASEAALREADRRKDEFMAMLSHELRNPLAPIRNSLYILDHVAPDTDQARRSKAVIDRQVGLLTRLVDDLLDVTRISRGKMKIQRSPVELGDLLRRTVEDHRWLFARSGLELDVRIVDGPLWVDGDAARLAQAAGNLLTNAAKFTHPGGHVTVALDEDAARRVAVLRVRDDGAGISPDLLPRLFLPFEQADRTLDRSRGGLGLGLALVKGVVEQHGGEVAAHSEGSGKGAEFTLWLPLASTATTDRPAPKRIPGATSRRVLVIEDNIDAADSLRQVLELGANVIEVAHDGPRALILAREFKPEVVLCDIGLPGMDGYEVARAFRDDDSLRGAHLIALSGYALPEDIQRAHEAGFERHLAKPPSLERLQELLESLSSRSRDLPS